MYKLSLEVCSLLIKNSVFLDHIHLIEQTLTYRMNRGDGEQPIHCLTHGAYKINMLEKF